MFTSGFYPHDFHRFVNSFAVPASKQMSSYPERRRRHCGPPRCRTQSPYQTHYTLVVPSAESEPETQTTNVEPRLAFYQDEASYRIEAEIPGFSKEQVSVEFTDGKTLRISGTTAPTVATPELVESAEQSPHQSELKAAEEPSDLTTDQRRSRSVSPKRTSIEEVRDESEAGYVEIDASISPHSPVFTESRTVSPAPQSEQSPRVIETPNTKTPQQHISVHIRTFEKYLELPKDIDRDNVSAELKDGILRLSIAKLSQDFGKRKISIA